MNRPRSKDYSKQRLDEILMREGVISEAQLKEALMRKRGHGGRLGSHLLYLGHVSEGELIKALCLQLDCKGVAISDREIPASVTDMIPRTVAVARNVIPFEYDSVRRILRIACEDPSDKQLMDELRFLVKPARVELYIAVQIALSTAIAKCYLGKDVSLNDKLLLEDIDNGTMLDEVLSSDGEAQSERGTDTPPWVLLVTDEDRTARMLRSLLERHHYRVMRATSIDSAMELIEGTEFHTILIRNVLSDGKTELEERVRRNSPYTVVRCYENAASLLLTGGANMDSGLVVKNLELLSSLLSSKAERQANHGSHVGRYADELCRKLGLPESDRILITNAAYLHDLAALYYGTDSAEDKRQSVQLTAKLLASFDYSPAVLGILDSMYIDLEQEYQQHLPLSVLGGNILTMVDLFCDATEDGLRLSLDRFDAIERRLRDLVGKLFLAEIVEQFIEMMRRKMLDVGSAQRTLQLMIFSEDATLLHPLQLRLRSEGFDTIFGHSIESLSELYQRVEPDLIILVTEGEPQRTSLLIEKLAASGVSFVRTPTFLLTKGSSIPRLTGLLSTGLEDILVLQGNFDLLITKIRKLQARINASARAADGREALSSGSLGRLADMSLIDLVQALGPSRKTVRITIRPADNETSELVIYLDRGDISFARLGNLTGAEAVYEGLTWADGTWNVQPVAAKDIPPANNHLANETILMEGCRLLDEKIRTGRLL